MGTTVAAPLLASAQARGQQETFVVGDVAVTPGGSLDRDLLPTLEPRRPGLDERTTEI